MKSSFCVAVAAGALAFCMPASLLAVDGVIEINQAKALAGGVVPDDNAGFPVTIDVSGSFRLTSDLDLSGASADTSAIEISNGASVSIDLNGFTIHGPNPCNPSCTTTGTGAGIDAQTSHVKIFNGFVDHMGGLGLDLIADGLVRDVIVRYNGGDGVDLSAGSVTNVESGSNGGNGIYVIRGDVTGSVAEFNSLNGIRVDTGVLKGCEADDNDGDGLLVDKGTVIGNTTELSGTGKHEFHCTGRCSYSLNNFASCARTEILANCVLADTTALQVPASSNMCLGQICP